MPTPSKKNQFTTWVKVLSQAQSVEREAWWVLTEERTTRGSFLRWIRALEKETPGLKKKKILSCEKFDLRNDVMDEKGGKFKGSLYESCQKPSKHILDYEVFPSMQMKIIFYPEAMPDVYGLGAAIFNKKVTCELKWNSKEILEVMKCTDYRRNRNEKQIVELSEFSYSKEGKSLLKLKGQVTESLLPIRKIESEVPLTGQIVVTETELKKPDEPAPKIQIRGQRGDAVEVQTQAAPQTGGAGPDLIRHQQSQKLKEFTPPSAQGSVREAPNDPTKPIQPSNQEATESLPMETHETQPEDTSAETQTGFQDGGHQAVPQEPYQEDSAEVQPSKKPIPKPLPAVEPKSSEPEMIEVQ